MTPKNGITQYRIDELEKSVDKLEIAVEKMLTNHLPHLQSEMESLKTRINVLTAINIGAVIFGIVAGRLLQ